MSDTAKAQTSQNDANSGFDAPGSSSISWNYQDLVPIEFDTLYTARLGTTLQANQSVADMGYEEDIEDLADVFTLGLKTYKEGYIHVSVSFDSFVDTSFGMVTVFFNNAHESLDVIGYFDTELHGNIGNSFDFNVPNIAFNEEFDNNNNQFQKRIGMGFSLCCQQELVDYEFLISYVEGKFNNQNDGGSGSDAPSPNQQAAYHPLEIMSFEQTIIGKIGTGRVNIEGRFDRVDLYKLNINETGYLTIGTSVNVEGGTPQYDRSLYPPWRGQYNRIAGKDHIGLEIEDDGNWWLDNANFSKLGYPGDFQESIAIGQPGFYFIKCDYPNQLNVNYTISLSFAPATVLPSEDPLQPFVILTDEEKSLLRDVLNENDEKREQLELKSAGLILTIGGLIGGISLMGYFVNTHALNGNINISKKTGGVLKEIFDGKTTGFLLLGQKLSRKDDVNEIIFREDFPPELLQERFLLHPVRLAMCKILKNNPQITSSELRTRLDIGWGDYTGHTKALSEKGYILLEDKIIDNIKKQVISLEPLGIIKFRNLVNLLDEYLDETIL